MGLFNFRKGDKKPSAPVTHAAHRADPPPAPQSAGDLARAIVQDVIPQLIRLEKVDLDFTPMSLTTVEKILDRCSARGMRSATQQGLVMGLGCYFGEIVRRHTTAQWVFHKDSPLQSTPLYPPEFMHLMIPGEDGDQYINLFSKIAQRLDGDAHAPIERYYHLIITGGMMKRKA